MRQRITAPVLVASTNPARNAQLRAIDGRKNTLKGPIHVGTRVGRQSRAVMLCDFVDMDKRFSIENGKFKCATNKERAVDRLLNKMSQKIS